MTYSEHVYWSVLHDSTCARISMCDANNREFFCILPGYEERGYRDKREQALEIIAEAIGRGMQPGEVRCCARE